jgi:MFS family permease
VSEPVILRAIFLVLVLGCVPFALAQTLVIPALPPLAADLGVSPGAASWILTATLLSASIATPIAGKLGDVHGKGRTLTWVLTIFSVGAVISALADSLAVLIAGRLLQGVAGGVFPLAFGIVRDTFPRERVATGLSLVGAMFGIGGGFGLPLSGVIVDHLSLPWLFWLGLVALPAAVASHRLIPDTGGRGRTRIDWLGAGLLSLSMAALLLGVTQGAAWGWGSAANVGTLAAGVALGVIWVVVELRVEEPFMDLDVLRRPAVAMTNLSALMVGLGMFAGYMLIPQFAQVPEPTGYGLGASVSTAGLLLAPAALTQLLFSPPVAALGGRFGFRATLAFGGLLTSAAFLLMAVAHDHAWELLASGALLGAGFAFAIASTANLIVEAVPRSDVGIATGINTVTRLAGGAFGAAITAAILEGSTAGGTGQPTELAYVAAFAFAGGTGLLAFAAALRLPRGAVAPEAAA